MAFTSIQDFVNWFTNEETKNKPAEITTPEEYNLMTEYLNTNPDNGEVLREFVQINDLDFKGGNINHIGTAGYSDRIYIKDFSYDGNNTIISNGVFILFGPTKWSTRYFILLAGNSIIKNLTINNCEGANNGETTIILLIEHAALESISFSNNYITAIGRYFFISRSGSNAVVIRASTNSIIECTDYKPYYGGDANPKCKYFACLDTVTINPNITSVYIMNGYGRYMYYRPKLFFTREARLYLLTGCGFNSYVAPIITKLDGVILDIRVTDDDNLLGNSNCGGLYYDKDILSEYNVTDGDTAEATKLGLSTAELQSEDIMSNRGWNITRTD